MPNVCLSSSFLSIITVISGNVMPNLATIVEATDDLTSVSEKTWKYLLNVGIMCMNYLPKVRTSIDI